MGWSLSMSSLAALTEDWDHRADELQRLAASLRYSVFSDLACDAGPCIEVACGTGFGLDLLDRLGVAAVGGDLTGENLQRARAHLPSAQLVQHDALRLPYRDNATATVACLEAIYYLPDLEGFITEAARVLRPGGRLLVTAPNPRRPGFNPSPGSTSYPTVADLVMLFRTAGLEPRIYGAFPWASSGWPAPLELLRRVMSRLGLIPRSQKAKAFVKRVVFRNIRSLAPLDTIDDLGSLLTEIDISDGRGGSGSCIVTYAVGTKH